MDPEVSVTKTGWMESVIMNRFKVVINHRNKTTLIVHRHYNGRLLPFHVEKVKDQFRCVKCEELCPPVLLVIARVTYGEYKFKFWGMNS